MKIIKKPESINSTTVGNLTISNDFIVSNFSASNYLYIPTDFTLTSNDIIELNVKAQRTGNGTGWKLLATMVYCIRDNYGKLEVGGQNEWEIYYDSCHSLGNSNYYTTTGIWYWYKCIINNNTKTINLYGSTTGQYSGEEVLITSGTFTNIIDSWYFRLGSDGGNSSDLGYGNYWAGQIDMKETNLKLNNNIIWEGIAYKYYYIHQNNKYYGINDTLNPPSNVIFDEVDSNNYITYKSNDGQTYWRKSYSGLCYGGFCVFEDGGSTWIIAFTISEVQNNCIMYRGDSRVLEISSGTLNYKGKNWYYSLNGNANNYNSATSTMIDFNKNNGRYWIGGENKVYTGSDNNEKFIQVAKDFLDYIYSF